MNTASFLSDERLLVKSRAPSLAVGCLWVFVAALACAADGVAHGSSTTDNDEAKAARDEVQRQYEYRFRYQMPGIVRLMIDKRFPDAFAIHQALIDGGREDVDIELANNSGQIDEFVVRVGLGVPADQFRRLMALILQHGKISRFGVIDDVAWQPGTYVLSVQRQTVEILRANREDHPIAEKDLRALLDDSLTDDAFHTLAVQQAADQLDRNFLNAQAIIDQGDRDNYFRAEEVLRELIDKQPLSVRNYIELARVQMKSVRPRENFKTSEGLMRANQTLEQALQIDAKDADLHVLLGYVRTEQGRLSEALKELNLAKTLGTNNRWLYCNLGLAHLRLHDEATAKKYYQQAVDYRVTGPDDRNRYAVINGYQQLVNTLIGLRDYAAADKVFQERETHPDRRVYTTFWCDGAYPLFRMIDFGDYAFAFRRFDVMRKKQCYVEPNLMAIAQFLKGEALRDQGSEAEAKEWLFKARTNIENPNYVIDSIALGEKTSLLLKRADKDLIALTTRDVSGNTALGMAVGRHEVIAVKRLIAAGVPVDDPVSLSGQTALMSAAINGDLDAVKILVEAGANISLRDVAGYTALDYAQIQGHSDIVDFLKTKSAQYKV